MVLTLGVLLRGFFISRTSPQRMIQSNLFGIRITYASRYSPAHVPDVPDVPDVPKKMFHLFPLYRVSEILSGKRITYATQLYGLSPMVKLIKK